MAMKWVEPALGGIGTGWSRVVGGAALLVLVWLWRRQRSQNRRLRPAERNGERQVERQVERHAEGIVAAAPYHVGPSAAAISGHSCSLPGSGIVGLM